MLILQKIYTQPSTLPILKPPTPKVNYGFRYSMYLDTIFQVYSHCVWVFLSPDKLFFSSWIAFFVYQLWFMFTGLVFRPGACGVWPCACFAKLVFFAKLFFPQERGFSDHDSLSFCQSHFSLSSPFFNFRGGFPFLSSRYTIDRTKKKEAAKPSTKHTSSAASTATSSQKLKEVFVVDWIYHPGCSGRFWKVHSVRFFKKRVLWLSVAFCVCLAPPDSQLAAGVVPLA